MKAGEKNQKTEDIIKEIIEEILQKMGFSFELEIKKEESEKEEESRINCNIKTEDSSFLIGQHGINLEALQHVARLIIRKRTENKVNFTLDVNGYRQEKSQAVSQLAKIMAEQAIAGKRAVVLRPMSSFERRIVHMELSGNSQVSTESIGEGEERKVIIKPTSLV